MKKYTYAVAILVFICVLFFLFAFGAYVESIVKPKLFKTVIYEQISNPYEIDRANLILGMVETRRNPALKPKAWR